jgi:TM2 domain-containing membrane protein YozV
VTDKYIQQLYAVSHAENNAPGMTVEKRSYDKKYSTAQNEEANGRYKKALNQYLEIENANTSNARILNNIGNCYFAVKDYVNAVKYYELFTAKTGGSRVVNGYLSSLKNAIKDNAIIYFPDEKLPIDFKSPGNAFIFTTLDPLPPLAVLMGYGTFYAKNSDQDWLLSAPNWFALLALAGPAVFFINGADPRSGINGLLAFDAGFFWGLSIMTDMISSPFIAVDNSLRLIDYLRENEVYIKSEKLSYKDPALAAGLSLLFPGAGHFYANDINGGIRSAILGFVIPGASMALTFAVNGNYMMHSLIISYSALRLLDIFGSSLYCDQNNGYYLRQVLCKNSPYRLTEKKEIKNPAEAFIISCIPIPGLGHFYSGNNEAGVTALILGGAGMISFFCLDQSNTVSLTMKYVGISIYGIAKLYEMTTAPGYTAVYNAIYADAKAKDRDPGRVDIIPSLMPDGFGLNMAYSF